MLGLAEKLSKNIPFMRSDSYPLDEKIYFGELTFFPTSFPASGFEKFVPESFDKDLGKLITMLRLRKDNSRLARLR